MKKLLFLLLIICLFSCEKVPNCWECKIQQTKTKVITQQYCDVTEDKIKEIEKQNTFSHNLNGVWFNQTCKCTLKN